MMEKKTRTYKKTSRIVSAVNVCVCVIGWEYFSEFLNEIRTFTRCQIARLNLVGADPNVADLNFKQPIQQQEKKNNPRAHTHSPTLHMVESKYAVELLCMPFLCSKRDELHEKHFPKYAVI